MSTFATSEQLYQQLMANESRLRESELLVSRMLQSFGVAPTTSTASATPESAKDDPSLIFSARKTDRSHAAHHTTSSSAPAAKAGTTGTGTGAGAGTVEDPYKPIDSKAMEDAIAAAARERYGMSLSGKHMQSGSAAASGASGGGGSGVTTMNAANALSEMGAGGASPYAPISRSAVEAATQPNSANANYHQLSSAAFQDFAHTASPPPPSLQSHHSHSGGGGGAADPNSPYQALNSSAFGSITPSQVVLAAPIPMAATGVPQPVPTHSPLHFMNQQIAATGVIPHPHPIQHGPIISVVTATGHVRQVHSHAHSSQHPPIKHFHSTAPTAAAPVPPPSNPYANGAQTMAYTIPTTNTAAATATATATAAAAAASSSVIDVHIESKPFWYSTATRDQAHALLRQPFDYVFRVCNDAVERIPVAGGGSVLNPNLFVMTFFNAQKDPVSMKVWRHGTMGIGIDRDPHKCTLYPSVEALVRVHIAPAAKPVLRK